MRQLTLHKHVTAVYRATSEVLQSENMTTAGCWTLTMILLSTDKHCHLQVRQVADSLTMGTQRP